MSARPQLYLHVGLPKSGTSAVQRWCRENQTALQQQGLSYPSTLRAPNSDKHDMIVPILRDAASAEPLEEMFRSTRSGRLILSNEGLTNHLYDFSEAALANFRRISSHMDTTVILLQRPRQAWLRSYHKQCVINPDNGASPLWGTTKTADEIANHPRVAALMNISELRQNLGRAFEANQVRCIDYAASNWFDLFRQIIGIRGLNTLPRVNQSLDDRAVDVLRHGNHILKTHQDRQILRSLLQHFTQNTHSELLAAARKYPIEKTPKIDHAFLGPLLAAIQTPENAELISFIRRHQI